MAVNKIKATSPEMFTLTPNSSLAVSGGSGIYFPDSGLVAIWGAAAHTSDIGTSTVLATVPQKYRPSGVRNISFRFTTGTNANATANNCNISSNGNITQGATGIGRAVDFWGVYQI